MGDATPGTPTGPDAAVPAPQPPDPGPPAQPAPLPSDPPAAVATSPVAPIRPPWDSQGGRYVIGLVAAALIGVAVPGIVDWLTTRFSAPIAVTLLPVEENPQTGWARVLPADFDPAGPVDPTVGQRYWRHQFRIAVTNRRAGSVTVVGFRTRVSPVPAADGTLFIQVAEGVGGGEEPDLPVALELDEPTPVARAFKDHVVGDPIFTTATVNVDAGQTKVFAVDAHSSRDVSWSIVLTLLIDGERTEQVVQDEDGPFRLLGNPDRLRHAYAWDFKAHRWATVPPGAACLRGRPLDCGPHS